MTTFYACLSTGLRGCYADNSISPVKFRTRRELKAAVAYEARDCRDAGMIGASERKIAAFVQEYWTRIHSKNVGYLDTCLPLAPSHSRGNYCMGVFLSPMSRADYNAACKELD